MVGRPGKLQSAFTGGEIDPLMHERSELKYFGTGLKHAENIEIAPQGGFSQRAGLRDVGGLAADAARLFPFNASDGEAYELVFRPGEAAAWGETAELDTITLATLTSDMLPEMTVAQQEDTMLVFHQDLETLRIKHAGPTSWAGDLVPFTNIPIYDYGATYTNGVAAEWEIEFVGLTDGSTVFVLTIAGQEIASITYDATMADLAPLVETAILDLPNVAAGVTVAAGTGLKLIITFDGDDNLGDRWAVSGRVVNKDDAAILAYKTVPGEDPGEPLISATRGWPQCGTFYGQRLCIGGFRSLPNAWMFSPIGDFFNFDDRLTEADGPALVPMDIPGGERIERIVSNRNLLVFTSKAEYWIAERALAATSAPQHVQSSTAGTRRGVPIVNSEGASIFPHANGSVLGETRYTDVEGNFVGTDISLLASHLVRDVADLAQRAATLSTDGNRLAVVLGDGSALLATLLREQEVTAFTRFSTTSGTFKAVARNGRNQLAWITVRPDGRRLERSEAGLLLDEAVTQSFGSPSAELTGLSRFNGRIVWVIGDNHVFGPYTVADGAITLPRTVSSATVGSWAPPVVQTLPPERTIGPGLVLKRRARIHSVTLSLIDTTSVAISTNGKPVRDVDLYRWGMTADVPELEAGFTGDIKISGLTGWADQPFVTISQVRPGRLNVRSITVQAQL